MARLQDIYRQDIAPKLTEQFGLDEWRAQHGATAVPLLVQKEDGAFEVGTVDQPLDPKAGETLVALVPEE